MASGTRFRKELGTKDVLMVAFGAMIGWGWVISAGEWILLGGVLGTVIGFLLGGATIFFVGLCYAELTCSMPKCGGEHEFVKRALGSNVAFICAWAIILSYVSVVCFEACSFPLTIQYIFPAFNFGNLYVIKGYDVTISSIISSILISVFLLILNIQGTKKAAKLQNILTLIIGITGLLFIAASALNGNSNALGEQLFVGETIITSSWSILRIAIMTPFFLFGFDVIPQVAEEIRIPLRKIGYVMLMSIVLAVLFYVMIVIAVGNVASHTQIKTFNDSGAIVTAEAMSMAFNSPNMTKVLILGGICGIITSWNSFLIGGGRAVFSLAESGVINPFFSHIHSKNRTPHRSLILVTLFAIIAPFFGKGCLITIVDAGNFSCCIAYFLVSISFLTLRKKEPDLPRPYLVKQYKTVGIISCILTGSMLIMYIIPGTQCSLKIEEWIIFAIWFLLGALLYKRKQL